MWTLLCRAAGIAFLCLACVDHPLRSLSLEQGLACDIAQFAQEPDRDRGDRLLRFWQRGKQVLGFSVASPRIIEALQDSTGRIRVVAAIAEQAESELGAVELLVAEFRGARVEGYRYRLNNDHAQRFDHKELRAYRRFVGPPYMRGIIEADSTVTPERHALIALSLEEREQARQLADTLGKLGCPRNGDAEVTRQ